MIKHYDVICIGTGGAGNTAAFRLASAGKSVLICDDKQFGGTCAISGCDPKKIMITAAELHDFNKRLSSGKVVKNPENPSWEAMMAHKREFTQNHSEKLIYKYNKSGVDFKIGRASFASENSVLIDGTEFSFDKALIATGSRPLSLSFEGAEFVCGNECFLDLDRLPEKILFIGGGYISVEFANIASAFGAECTIVQLDERLVPDFEPEIINLMTESLADKGIEILTGAMVKSITENSKGDYTVHIKKGETSISKDVNLVVHGAGRVPNLDGMELEKGNVEYARRGIQVNEYMQSKTNKNVYAGGDCADTDGYMLSPIAFMEGYVAASNILEENSKKPDYTHIGTVMFNVPSVSAVGYTEKQAVKAGLDFRVNFKKTEHWFTSFRYMEKFSGYKILIDNKTNKILGAHLIGPHADDIINVFVLAMKQGMTIYDLKKIIYAYPTASSDIIHMLS